jgi:hypothetical protein
MITKELINNAGEKVKSLCSENKNCGIGFIF